LGDAPIKVSSDGIFGKISDGTFGKINFKGGHMRKINLLSYGLAFVSFLSPVYSASVHASTPIEKRVPVDHVYSPKGFDTNDSVEVVVSGFLPNLCHRAPRAKATVNGDTVNVELKSLYYQPSDPFCPPVVVPFIETLNLGLLNKGNYKIVVNGGQEGRGESKLKITESTSDAIDDFVYAGVEYVEKQEGSRTVTLKGYNPTDCYELDKIQSVSNGTDTLAVLPIMKKVHDFCPLKMIPFSYDFEVPASSDLKTDTILLHVRRMEGKSVNTLFPNK